MAAVSAAASACWRDAGSVVHRSGAMSDIEPVPSCVLHPAMLAAGDPFHPADWDDVAALPEVRRSLQRVRPVSLEQQPCRRDGLEMVNQSVQRRSISAMTPRRVSNNTVDAAVIIAGKRILALRN